MQRLAAKRMKRDLKRTGEKGTRARRYDNVTLHLHAARCDYRPVQFLHKITTFAGVFNRSMRSYNA